MVEEALEVLMVYILQTAMEACMVLEEAAVPLSVRERRETEVQGQCV
tara:strand:- start:886 stop:1026 length:141 start_codon:yes stop_codon:yes gene_type:complete